MTALSQYPLAADGIGVILLALFIWYGGPLLRLRPLSSLRLGAGADHPHCPGDRRDDRRQGPQARSRQQEERQPHRRRRQAVETGDTKQSAEAQQLRERFEEAVATLKQKRRSGHSLYDLPWYVIIGAPGSGKTTALVNSGLKFPIEQRSGKARAARRRRHAQLRLVVHRRGRAARHRRPLHDAGFRRRRPTARRGRSSSRCCASTAAAGRSTASSSRSARRI